MPLMKEKQIRDLLTASQELPSIQPEAGLNEALELIASHLKKNSRLNFALVSGKAGPEGLINLVDILGSVRPGGIREGYYRGWGLPGRWSSPAYLKGIFSEKCVSALRKKVKHVMRPLKYDLHPEDTLAKAADILYQGKSQCLTVGENGHFLGIITLYDVIQEMRLIWEEEKQKGILHRSEAPEKKLYPGKITGKFTKRNFPSGS